MSNAIALRTVLEHVQENHDDWHQGEWSNCFAGQTLRVLLGATSVVDCCPECGGLDLNGERLYGSNIGVRAALELGLTPDQATRLFHAGNSLEFIRELIEEFTADSAPAPEMALTA